MKRTNTLSAAGAWLIASAVVALSGCVVHDREVVHDGNYSQGYKEGYYDSQHHRYWHDQAWRDCVENDVHCQ
jgi:hypothetical protein